jgi:hypothetical protein
MRGSPAPKLAKLQYIGSDELKRSMDSCDAGQIGIDVAFCTGREERSVRYPAVLRWQMRR